MSKRAIKIVNMVTGREFSDLDENLIAYAENDTATFKVFYEQVVGPEIDKETFELDDLKKMSMKSLKDVYDTLAALLGEAMPKARKNSPTEVMNAILVAQDIRDANAVITEE